MAGIRLAVVGATGAVAEQGVPIAATRGAIVVDNSAAFRMAEDIPLVIPEINGDTLDRLPRRIVANPNCTVATFAVPLAPLHREARLRRLIACSYQSVSGAGEEGEGRVG